MRKYIVSCFLLVFAVAAPRSILRAEPFSFVAMGDMPYGESAEVETKFKALITAINARKPVFTIHVGDIKSGRSRCTNTLLLHKLELLNSLESAVIYTPGDNDWTDCHRKRMNPIKRLDFLRANFFPSTKSLGESPIILERQADVMADASQFVENARFEKDGILVITAHVVGSNNNFKVHDRAAVKEFFERDGANLAWLTESFRKARGMRAKAVVLAVHADMFESGFALKNEEFNRHSGFKHFGERLVKEANNFDRPVLLIFGDSHKFRVFRPFPKSASNIVALEVFGNEYMHAVEITAEPSEPAVFSIRPLFNPIM